MNDQNNKFVGRESVHINQTSVCGKMDINMKTHLVLQLRFQLKLTSAVVVELNFTLLFLLFQRICSMLN